MIRRKRFLPIPDQCGKRGRYPVRTQDYGECNSDMTDTSSSLADVNLRDDVKSTLLYLRNIFPLEKFENRLPPVMVKNQLYSIIKNRTLVDKQLNELRSMGEVRLIKLGLDGDDFGIVFTDDYKKHVKMYTRQIGINQTIIDKFITTVVRESPDISLDRSTMTNLYQFKDDEISLLIKASILTIRDVGSWWFSLPCLGIFMKSFTRGRKAILTTIRKCKYREILQQELEARKLPKIARLGMTYHIYDIIGAQLVQCINTTSGRLLRVND